MRPRITFDAEGVCSACRFAEYKETVDWSARQKELEALCNKHRRGNGQFDVIVPVSGGKDGGFVAHKLKHAYGMTPPSVPLAPPPDHPPSPPTFLRARADEITQRVQKRMRGVGLISSTSYPEYAFPIICTLFSL